MVCSRLFQWLHTYSTRFRPFPLWLNPIWPKRIGQISGGVDNHYGNQCPLRWSSNGRPQRIIKETKVPLPELHLGSNTSSCKSREQYLSNEYLWGLQFFETWSHSTINLLHPMIFWSYISCALLPTSQPSEDARLARRQRIVPREECSMQKNSRTTCKM